MIEARYSSKCPGCDERILEGDDIGLIDDERCCAECVADYGEDEEELQ